MEKRFNGPLDQALHQFERTLLAGAAFFVCMWFIYYVVNFLGWAGLGLILLFPILLLSVVGAGMYATAIYRLGRIHWAPRVLLNAGVLLLFYFLVLPDK